MLGRSLANKAIGSSQGSDTSSAYGGSDVLQQGLDDVTQIQYSDVIQSCDYDVSQMEADDVSNASDSDLEDEGNISEISSIKSIALLDHVKDCFEKDPEDRSEEEIEMLMSFIQPIRAFNSMTHTTKHKLCRHMRLVSIDRSDTIIMSDGEELDSWSVILNGSVEVTMADGRILILKAGDTFGVTLSTESEFEEGEMKTREDECIFICIAKLQYQEIMNEIKEMTVNIEEDGEVVIVFEKRIENKKEYLIAIRGRSDKLIDHLMDNNTHDSNFTEDLLLTYPAFLASPLPIAEKLLNWFQSFNNQEKVARILLHWVNNHYQDFDYFLDLAVYIEKFQMLFFKQEMYGQLSLLHMACRKHSEPRHLQLRRQTKDDPLGFSVEGGIANKAGIFVTSVECPQIKMSGLKRGDQLLEVNKRSFEQINLDEAKQYLLSSHNLCLVVKSNFTDFFRLHQCNVVENVSLDTSGLSDEFDDHSILSGSSNRSDNSGTTNSSTSKDNLTRVKSDRMTKDISKLSNKNSNVQPEADVIKVFRPDESFKFLFIHKETTCREVVMLAVTEFQLPEASCNYNLYEIFFENGDLTKTKMLPPQLKDLAAHSSLHSRYYLRHMKSQDPSPTIEVCQTVLSDCKTCVTNIDETELANKLFERSKTLFSHVVARDYVDDLFQVKGRHPTASLLQVSKLVNEEMFWVINEICCETNLAKRVKLIKFFIKVAQYCYQSRNFNTLFALVSGLGHKSVNRLKLTWKRLPDKYIKIFDELQSFLDPTRNMSKYRNALSTNAQSKPTIPLFPLVLKDLTFLHLGNSSQIDGLINFDKMRNISNELRKIHKLSCLSNQSQKVMLKRNLTTNTSIKKIYESLTGRKRLEHYLSNLNIIYDEDRLNELSEKCEIPKKKAEDLKPIQRIESKNLKNHKAYVENMFGTEDTVSFQKLISLSATGERTSRRSRRNTPKKCREGIHVILEGKVDEVEKPLGGLKKSGSFETPSLNIESSSILPSSPNHLSSKNLDSFSQSQYDSIDNESTLTRLLSNQKSQIIYSDIIQPPQHSSSDGNSTLTSSNQMISNFSPSKANLEVEDTGKVLVKKVHIDRTPLHNMASGRLDLYVKNQSDQIHSIENKSPHVLFTKHNRAPINLMEHSVSIEAKCTLEKPTKPKIAPQTATKPKLAEIASSNAEVQTTLSSTLHDLSLIRNEVMEQSFYGKSKDGCKQLPSYEVAAKLVQSRPQQDKSHPIRNSISILHNDLTRKSLTSSSSDDEGRTITLV